MSTGIFLGVTTISNVHLLIVTSLAVRSLCGVAVMVGVVVVWTPPRRYCIWTKHQSPPNSIIVELELVFCELAFVDRTLVNLLFFNSHNFNALHR